MPSLFAELKRTGQSIFNKLPVRLNLSADALPLQGWKIDFYQLDCLLDLRLVWVGAEAR